MANQDSLVRWRGKYRKVKLRAAMIRESDKRHTIAMQKIAAKLEAEKQARLQALKNKE